MCKWKWNCQESVDEETSMFANLSKVSQMRNACVRMIGSISMQVCHANMWSKVCKVC